MGLRHALGCLVGLWAGVGCTEAATTTDAAVVDASASDATDAPMVDAPVVDAGVTSPDDVALPADVGQDAGFAPLDYTRDELWLCRPGMAGDRCLSADLTATEIAPDGARTTVTSTPAANPAYDCFYIYPTVDVTGLAGNHTDLTNPTPMLDPLLNQAARFREQCRVVAPLYRQSTLLGLNGSGAAARLELAFRDVEAAFREYLRRDNAGRPFVLMGHSQGSFMAERLLTQTIVPDAAVRARLVVALLLGGSVQVPTGATTGGSIGAYPLCTSDDQTGCALAYHTFGADRGPTAGGVYPSSVAAGRELACTNPAALADAAAATRVRSVYLPTFAYQSVFDVRPTITPAVTTPFLRLRDFYTVRCTTNANLRSYLELRAAPMAGDTRADPIPYGSLILAPSFLGLHLLDYNVALDELQALVARKAARFLAGR